jgi:hypothetical protein
MIRARRAVQVLVSMGAAVQALGFKITKAIRTAIVITSRITKGISSNQVTKVTPSSCTADNIMCSLLACASEMRSFARGQLMLLNRLCHIIYDGRSSPSCGAERITHPGLTIRVN